MIPFHVPYIAADSEDAVGRQVFSGQISGQGKATMKCHDSLRHQGYAHPLLTTSGSSALAMCAQLTATGEGDEVVVPAFTHPSSASPFVRVGVRIKYADLDPVYPNISVASIESVLTDRTRVIVMVHYGGVACKMDEIRDLAKAQGVLLIEDAAHGIGATYPGTDAPLGSKGDLGILSFHQTKNIHCGDGGMLSVNRLDWVDRAHVLWEKGTNRTAYMQGRVPQYEWMSAGSCYYPNELTAAFLSVQLPHVNKVNAHRRTIWEAYHHQLRELEDGGHIMRPRGVDVASANAHVYFILAKNLEERGDLQAYLANYDIDARTHYIPLHRSTFGRQFLMDDQQLTQTDLWSDRLLRLPLHTGMRAHHADQVCDRIQKFYAQR